MVGGARRLEQVGIGRCRIGCRRIVFVCCRGRGEGAGEPAVVAGFLAVDEVERAGLVAQVADAFNQRHFGGRLGLVFVLKVGEGVDKTSRDSQARTTALDRRPCRSAFRDEVSLPSGVRGPRDFAPLAREARRRASVIGYLLMQPHYAAGKRRILGFLGINALELMTKRWKLL